MLLDLGFLGDTVHLLPSAWCIRQACPRAELHVMVADHVKELLKLTPYIDRAWGYVRFPRSLPPYKQFPLIRKLRAEKFDVAINLNGSDRSSILTRLTGAPWRLGRRPDDGGGWFWDSLFTHVVDFPYATAPISTQRFECLRSAGFPGEKPEFHVTLPETHLAEIREQLSHPYIHVSPCATQDIKELPLEQLAEVLNTISKMTDRQLVLSCAPNVRERTKIENLQARLKFQARVFAGDLNLLQLTTLIGQSTLHLGADSGALHLAWLTGVPAAAWFRNYSGIKDWLPVGANYRTFVGEASTEGLRGIDTPDLLAGIRGLLRI